MLLLKTTMSQANEYSRISEIQKVSKKIITDGITEWVTVYFKEAFLTNIKYYNIKINWTMEQFVNIVKEWIMEDFNISIENLNVSIDIIEIGQEIPGVKPENGCCVEEEQITYYNKYIINNKYPSFYIKITFTTN